MSGEIVAFNRRGLWAEVIERLDAAQHEIGLVQGLLDDLAIYGDVPPWQPELARLGAAIKRISQGAETVRRQ